MDEKMLKDIESVIEWNKKREARRNKIVKIAVYAIGATVTACLIVGVDQYNKRINNTSSIDQLETNLDEILK